MKILYKIEMKKEREILLDSAATDLTRNFREWWKQENYSFEFFAESSELQWFFSFYLIFMSETKNKHKNAILLLDEPGHTLHPMVQKIYHYFLMNYQKIIN
ncbi:MAG: hypothetical protein RR325_02680 [Bacilli bacterium]